MFDAADLPFNDDRQQYVHEKQIHDNKVDPVHNQSNGTTVQHQIVIDINEAKVQPKHGFKGGAKRTAVYMKAEGYKTIET